MTTPSTSRKAGPLLGTGAQTTWPFTFKVFAATDIAVTIADNQGVETALVYNLDYSVTLNANQETSPGGTVTYPIAGSPLPVGTRLVIFGNLPYDQPLDLPSGGNFSPLALENQLDRTVMQVQQLRENVDRALQLPVTADGALSVQLPPPSANQLIGWDASGSNLQNVPLTDIAVAVAFATYRYDTFTGDGVETQFTLSADPTTLGNLDIAVGGVTQTPGTDYTLLNGVLVFSSAPPLGATVLARYGEGLPSGAIGDALDVAYTPAGTGAVPTTVQAKLRETVSVKNFGAIGDGIANDTTAFANAIASSNQVYVPDGIYALDEVIFNTAGLSGVNFTGQTTTGTVLRPTSAATNFFSVTGTYNQYNIFSNFTIDMVNMPNLSTSRGMYFSRTWGNSVRNVNIINHAANTRTLYLDVGTYTSVFDNCDFGGLTGIIQIQGISVSDAVTTISFIGCSFASALIDAAVSISFFQPIVQGSLNKFVISNVFGVSILNGDIEGTGTYLTINGSFCYGVASSNNALAGFSGTYLSGGIASGYLMDHYGSTPFTFTPIDNMTVYGVVLETSSASAITRKVIRNTSGGAYRVDLQFENVSGSTYVGQTGVGESVIDARGNGKAVIQQSGTDRLGFDTSNRLIIGTATATSATAGTNGAPPAQVSGYLRFVNSAGTEIGKIPYYNT